MFFYWTTGRGKMKKIEEKDELDINFDDIAEKPVPSLVVVSENAIDEAIKFIEDHAPPASTEEDKYQKTIANLKARCGEENICLPTGDGLHPWTKDLKEVTGQEFLDWLYYVYPVAKEMGFTVEDCNNLDYRQKTFSSIVKTWDYFKWPSKNVFEKSTSTR